MRSYGDGIHVDRTTLNGESVVEVRGLSAKVPDLQLQDYYFIERNNLYGFLFSVQPAKAMASYEPLIEKIAGSLIFLPVKNQ
jgi:hypothetical protein